jgi:hypothetical protein
MGLQNPRVINIQSLHIIIHKSLITKNSTKSKQGLLIRLGTHLHKTQAKM